MVQIALLCRVAPVTMYIHVPGDVVKDLFVRCSSPDNGQYILFMTGEYGHLTSFPPLPFLTCTKRVPSLAAYTSRTRRSRSSARRNPQAWAKRMCACQLAG